jgi:hypothetical protein
VLVETVLEADRGRIEAMAAGQTSRLAAPPPRSLLRFAFVSKPRVTGFPALHRVRKAAPGSAPRAAAAGIQTELGQIAIGAAIRFE